LLISISILSWYGHILVYPESVTYKNASMAHICTGGQQHMLPEKSGSSLAHTPQLFAAMTPDTDQSQGMLIQKYPGVLL
jgi:hypothetical protein